MSTDCQSPPTSNPSSKKVSAGSELGTGCIVVIMQVKMGNQKWTLNDDSLQVQRWIGFILEYELLLPFQLRK